MGFSEALWSSVDKSGTCFNPSCYCHYNNINLFLQRKHLLPSLFSLLAKNVQPGLMWSSSAVGDDQVSLFYSIFGVLLLAIVLQDSNMTYFSFLQVTNDLTLLNGVIEFFEPKNICLDTKIVILSDLEAEISVSVVFYS